MCGPRAFAQFIDILIDTKHNGIAHLFENYPEFKLLPPLL